MNANTQRVLVLVVGILQAGASAALLISTAELASIATRTVHASEQPELQLPLAAIVVVALLPIAAAAVSAVCKVPLDQTLMVLFSLFLVVVLFAAAQAFGSWRLWSDHQVPLAVS